MKVYIRNRQRAIKLSQKRIIKLIKKLLQLLDLKKAELSILFVNDWRMKVLNRNFRGVDKTTDVLSFPQYLPPFKSPLSKRGYRGVSNSERRTPNFVLGDIVINLHRAKRQAIEREITLNEEVKRLIIHGLLHLLGYNHDRNRYQKKKMELKEKELYDAC